VQSPATKPVALITGGAKRVGRAIATRLHQAGYTIAFTYLSSDNEAGLLARELNALPIRTDLTQPDQAAGHIATMLASFSPRLDVLVNNASLYEPSSLTDFTLDQSRRLFAIHVETPALLARTLEPHLRQSRGHIINMSDLLAERPWPEYLLYSATKAALSSLTLGLARALAPDVTVNAIAPGVVQWPDDYPQEDRDKYLKRVPLGRAGTPEHVADLVHFLCTKGSYITGQILRLDGGRSIT
jgi:pteridine reductase